MRRVPLILAALGAAACALPACAGAVSARELIKDGGFEQPVVRAYNYQSFIAGTSFSGWNVVGAGDIVLVNDQYGSDGVTFNAQAGHQTLDLTGTTNNATGVTQKVKTVKRATYKLVFWLGNVVDPGGPFGSTSTAFVLINGHRKLTAVNSGGSKMTYWKRFSLSFKAGSASTTIGFLNGDPSDDSSNAIDSVSLKRTR